MKKQLVEIKNNSPKTLRLQYELSNVCNYKCWYCFPGSNEGTVGWPDVDVVKNNLVTIIEFYFNNGIDEIQLNLLGGEPTLWKDLGELVKHVCEKSNYDRKKKKLLIIVKTNASRTLRWWKEYGHYFDHVGISIHHETVNLDHIVDVVEILLEKKVSVLTAVLMDHTAWDKCKSMVDYLVATKTKFMVLAGPIHINGETTYTEDQLKYLRVSRKRHSSFVTVIRHFNKFFTFKKHIAIFDDGSKETIKADHYFILNKINNFFGWQCTLGTNFLYITREGSITGTCRAKLYGMDDYFNINDPDLKNKFHPTLQTVTCHRLDCLCGAEAMLSKWKTTDQPKVIPIHAN
jgi:sulfatase maturation enzyme AslB (radical SAM superfamily)